ncbi:Interferon-induced 35 kDa protein, partial [Nibea albiflora]
QFLASGTIVRLCVSGFLSRDGPVRAEPGGSQGINRQLQVFVCPQKKHAQLLKEQDDLKTCRDETRKLTQEFRLRTEKLTQTMQKNELSNKDEIGNEYTLALIPRVNYAYVLDLHCAALAKLNKLQDAELDLLREIEKVEAAMKEEDAQNYCLKQQTDVFTAVPERNFCFKGATERAVKAQMFEMDPRVEYPMEGGTALVTFEEEVVAKKILEMKSHQVNLGESECSITVEARPVQLMVPSLVEINTDVCPRRILISDLPRMDTE